MLVMHYYPTLVIGYRIIPSSISYHLDYFALCKMGLRDSMPVLQNFIRQVKKIWPLQLQEPDPSPMKTWL